MAWLNSQRMSISHFVMNIIVWLDWLNRQSKFLQSKFRQMTYFQQSDKITGHTVLNIALVSQPMVAPMATKVNDSHTLLTAAWLHTTTSRA